MHPTFRPGTPAVLAWEHGAGLTAAERLERRAEPLEDVRYDR